MNIADALAATADHIEQNPERYDFNQGMVLGEGDEMIPACMLARLGQMVGIKRGTRCDLVAHTVLGISANDFYERILQDAGHPGFTPALHVGAMMAPALRKMAQRYEGIPAAVREIFNVAPEPNPEDMLTRYRCFTHLVRGVTSFV
jgi:hypothetical protein